jgi:hypothetical protein
LSTPASRRATIPERSAAPLLRDERAAWIKENRSFRIMPARATKAE